MFKILKNLIPVSRKRYEKEKAEYLKDVKQIEPLKVLIERRNDTINDLSRALDEKKEEIDRLEKQIEFSSDSLEKERERYSELFKTFIDFINKQEEYQVEEDQVKAVG